MDQFCLGLVRALYILLKVANKNAVDNPHIKMPVNPSSAPNRRHSFGSTKYFASIAVACWRHDFGADPGAAPL
jgi:hypothetical protein